MWTVRSAAGATWLAGLVLAAAVGCQRPSMPEEERLGESASRRSPAAAVVPREITVEVAGRDEYDRLIASHRGKVVLVDFWSTGCIPCLEQFPHTVALSHKHAEDGLAVISVSLDDVEDRKRVLEQLRAQQATFDNLLSRDGMGVASMKAFDIDGGLPHYKLYDRRGNLRYSFSIDAQQPLEPEDIQRRVMELLTET